MSSIRALAADLAARSDDQLRALLEARPDLCLPRVPDFAALASRASTRISVQRALEKLSRPQLDVLEAVDLSTGPDAEHGTTAANLQSVIGGSTIKALDTILAELHSLALLHRTAPPTGASPANARRAHYLPVSGVKEALGPYPAGLGRPYPALAAAHPDFGLRIVETVNRIRAGSGRTEKVAGPIAAAAEFGQWLADRAHWDALLTGAPAGTRELLARFTAPPPAASPIGSIPGKPGGGSDPHEAGPVEWLISNALLVPLDVVHVELPREAGFAVRGHRWVELLQREPTQPDLPTVTDLIRDNAAFGSVAETLRLLTELTALVESGSVATLRAGGVGVREVRRLAEGMRVDVENVAWLLELAAMAELIVLDVDTSRWVQADPEWPLLDRDAQWLRIVRAWLDSPRAPALATGPDSVAALSAEAGRPDAPMVRRRLLTALADLSRPDSPKGRSAVGGSAVGRSPVIDAATAIAFLGWHQPRLHRRFTRLVPGMLIEAGRLGLTGSGALTGLGRALQAEQYDDAAALLRRVLPEPLGHFMLQADLTAVAPGYLEPAVARELALLSTPEGQGPATIFRFSPDSVRSALDAGQDASSILAFFEQHSATPVPQPLQYLVEDTAARYGRLRVGSVASYLRSDDDEALNALLADSRAASLGLRRLAQNVAVSRAPAPELTTKLRELGYAPAPDTEADGVTLSAGLSAAGRSAAGLAAVDRRGALSAGASRGLTDASRARLNPWTLTPEDVAHQLAALRGAARAPAAGGPAGETGTLIDLETLRRAIRLKAAVRMGVVDQMGNQNVETVVPLSVSGGRVRVYDAARDVERVVSIHRVMDVELVDVELVDVELVDVELVDVELVAEGQQEEVEQG